MQQVEPRVSREHSPNDQTPSPAWRTKQQSVLEPVTDRELQQVRRDAPSSESVVDDLIDDAMNDMGDMCTQADRSAFIDKWMQEDETGPRKRSKSKMFMPKVRHVAFAPHSSAIGYVSLFFTGLPNGDLAGGLRGHE
jgi:hypothetical protein